MATLKLTRPIIGIEYRTPQDVFDIMCARIKFAAKSDLRAGMEKAAGIADAYGNLRTGSWHEDAARAIAAAIRQAAEEA